MNKYLLMAILTITGICFVPETHTMAARLARFRKHLFKKKPTRLDIKRTYTKAIKTGTKKQFSRGQKVALAGGAITGYGLWDWFKEKLGFGQKTTLSEHQNFIPTPDQIARRYEKMDENPNVQFFSQQGYTRISQVVKDIEKQSGKKLDEETRKKLELFLYGQLNQSDSKKYVEASNVVPSLELLPILLYYTIKKDANVPTSLLPAKEFSPFIYSPLVQLFNTVQPDAPNIDFIVKSICDIVEIKNMAQKEKFEAAFLDLINKKYSTLLIKKDLLLVRDFSRSSDKGSPQSIRMFGQFYADTLTFNNTDLNEKWHDIYSGGKIQDYIDKKVYIKHQTRGLFTRPQEQSIYVDVRHPLTDSSIFKVYEEKGLKTDIQNLVKKHGGKISVSSE